MSRLRQVLIYSNTSSLGVITFSFLKLFESFYTKILFKLSTPDLMWKLVRSGPVFCLALHLTDTLSGDFLFIYLFIWRESKGTFVSDGERGDKIKANVNGYTFYIIMPSIILTLHQARLADRLMIHNIPLM